MQGCRDAEVHWLYRGAIVQERWCTAGEGAGAGARAEQVKRAGKPLTTAHLN